MLMIDAPISWRDVFSAFIVLQVFKDVHALSACGATPLHTNRLPGHPHILVVRTGFEPVRSYWLLPPPLTRCVSIPPPDYNTTFNRSVWVANISSLRSGSLVCFNIERLERNYDPVAYKVPGCGGWIRTNDLWVMSPMSYHCYYPTIYIFRTDGEFWDLNLGGISTLR